MCICINARYIVILGWKYLGSDVPWDAQGCKVGWQTCKVDQDYQTRKTGSIDINGTIFTRGIVAHAASTALFVLDGHYTCFKACVGISKLDKDARCGITVGDARFRLVNDDDGSFLPLNGAEWIVKGSPEDATCFTVDVKDVQKLQLETDLNGSRDCDLSTWADARVLRKGKCIIKL